jgi:UDP-N-acetylmuramyl pentapeptide phosphotransferase/UDP-N-acetylglucosamine-1-phosphate transferase
MATFDHTNCCRNIVAFVIVANRNSWNCHLITCNVNTAKYLLFFGLLVSVTRINFFDNLDGAASGAVAIAALGVFFIAFDRGQELVSALSIVTAGATIGFLMWNKSPAKIYMGDAGALFLGVIISVATIRLNPGITPTWQSLAIPIMLLSSATA